jgi:hypothetical protein
MSTPDNIRVTVGKQTRAYLRRGWLLSISKSQYGKWLVSLERFSSARRPHPNALRVASAWDPDHQRFGFVYELRAKARSLEAAFAALERQLATNRKAESSPIPLGDTTAQLLEQGAVLCVWRTQKLWRARLFQVSRCSSPLWADATTLQAALDALENELANDPNVARIFAT